MIVIVRTDRVANTVLPCRYLLIIVLVDKIELIWYEVYYTVGKFYFLIDYDVITI